MMKKVILFLFLFTIVAVAQSGMKHFFEQGNQAYREGEYQTALEWYRKIVGVGYRSSPVYYNMGNCFYKLGQTGYAILYYEKALQLDPRDREIKFNLELANLKVVDRLEAPPQFFLFTWWDTIKTYFSISQLTRLMITLYVVTILMLIAFLFLRYHAFRKVILSLLIVFTVLTLFASYILYLNVQTENEHIEAIVLVSSVNVLSEPNENSIDVFVLHEGVKVNLSQRRGEWVEISLPDGKSGWIKQENLGII
jgi:tetratricopeptide (TPR) repeat protein